jgi:hypothetical protein
MSGSSIIKQATQNVLRRNAAPTKGAQYWSRALPSIEVSHVVFYMLLSNHRLPMFSHMQSLLFSSM